MVDSVSKHQQYFIELLNQVERAFILWKISI